MAKQNHDATTTIGLPKANAYSVLTICLTLGLIAMALTVILGLPYLTYTMVASDSNALLAERVALNFQDLVEFTYFYPVFMISGSADGILSTPMALFFNDIIKNIAPNYLSITIASLLIAGGVFEVLFIIFSFVILGCSISAFKKGSFKKLRSATRGTGIFVMITFLPAIILNILFVFIKGDVKLSFGTFLPFILIIIGIVIEAINASSYKKHLKNAVVDENITTPCLENELKEEEINTPSEEVTTSNDAPLEEIKEDRPYKVCPNCGAHADLDDRFCEECGQALDEAVVIKSETIKEDECCSCCCGCEAHEEITPSEEEKIEEEKENIAPAEEIKVEENVQEERKIAENEDVKVVVVGENGTRVIDKNNEVGTRRVVKVIGLPTNLAELSDHRFAKNGQLQVARIPSNITELGVGCFANCYNLEEVSIPLSVTKICANALFACSKLRKITYEGTIAQFKKIERQTNWLTSAGTNIIACSDGEILIQ